MPGENVGSVTVTTLQEFEAWATQDWIYARGSDEAQVHARGKLREEAGELAEALASGNREEVLSELGDFLWTANANGINTGISCTTALRHELREEQIGAGPISLDRIDRLALELMPDLPVDEMEGWVKYLSHYLGKAAKQWRNLSPLIEIEAKSKNFTEACIQLKRLRVYDALTQSILISSAVAQRYADATISDVIAVNIEKIQNRKAVGLPVTSLAE